MIQAALNKLGELYYGWRMVAVGCAIRILGGGLHLYGFTVFFLPVSQDLGLTRAATSLVFSLARAEGALEGPLVGYLIDRYGPRPVILFSTLLTGLGYILMAGVNSYAMLLLVYVGIVSLSYQAGFMDATMQIAANWFIRQRAQAMAWISACISLGGTLVTPFLALAVYSWGWRVGAIVAGATFIVVGVPFSLLLRRSPESMGLRPDGELPQSAKPATTGQPANSAEPDFSLRKTLRTRQFWQLVVATLLRVGCLSAVLVHFVPIMVWKGLSEQRAAVLLGAAALIGLPSHLVVGWLADRLNKPRLMASCMILASVAVLILLHSSAEWQLWIYLVLYSVVESIFPVGWATVGDFFGRKNFAKVRGSMSFFYMWGSVIGPVIAGVIYDQTKSYSTMLWLLVATLWATAVAYGTLARPR